MEQLPPLSSENSKSNGKTGKSRRLPSPQEMVSYYEKQGLETQEASFKVIQDLQSALFRVVNSNRNRKQTAKLDDAVQSRLLRLEMKLDSKPSYPQALGIGIASSGIWNAAVQLWFSIRRATDT